MCHIYNKSFFLFLTISFERSTISHSVEYLLNYRHYVRKPFSINRDPAMSNTIPKYTLLDHTADLGIIVRGSDLVNLFKNAGKAMMHLMLQSKPLPKTTFTTISIVGSDLEDLMVRWLGEILYLFESEYLVVTDIDRITISNFNLIAILKIVPFNPESHEIVREIKAVTYHQIEVAQKNGEWIARIIFDL